MRILGCLSDNEEKGEIVILSPDIIGQVTDKENDKSEDDDRIRKVADEMEVHLQKKDKNSDDVETANKRKKSKPQQKI